MKTKIPAVPYIVWALIFTLVPLGVILVFAFTSPSIDGFTLKNLGEVSAVWPAFSRSLWLAAIATIICLLISYPFAYFISRAPERRQPFLYMLAILPMWVNFILRTYAWMTLLEGNGLINKFLISVASLIGLSGFQGFEMINTSGAVVLGMVYDYIPFMILPLYSIMVKIDGSMIEAAQDLGAGPRSVLSRVIVPLSLPGISTGIIMVFVPAISTFIISQMLGGGKTEMIGDIIEARFMLNPHVGSALSLVLMVIVFVVISVINQSSDTEEMGDMIR